MAINIVLPHGPDFKMINQIMTITTSPLACIANYYHDRIAWLAIDHFPDQPIMPGMMQIIILRKCANRLIPGAKLVGVKNVLLKKIIKPNTDLALLVKMDRDPDNVNQVLCDCSITAYEKPEREFFNGQLVFDSYDKELLELSDVTTFRGDEIWLLHHISPNTNDLPNELLLEAMAQTGLQVSQAKSELDNKYFAFQSIESATFSEYVRFGDIVILSAKVDWIDLFRIGSVDCQAHVGDKKIAEAKFNFVVLTKRHKNS